MKRFAELLDALVYMPSRNGKVALLRRYFAEAPDPDRGWALAAITGEKSFRRIKPGMVRELVTERVDPVLFQWSYDYVGDLAETTALIWPERDGINDPDPPGLAELVDELAAASRLDLPGLLAGWLDRLDATGRWALLKFLTGGLRVGVSARLARTALAAHGGVTAEEVEAVWHGFEPPYREIFDWIDGRAPRPDVSRLPVFHPVMLANPLEEGDLEKLDPRDWRAEWKWDGVRVQLVSRGGEVRLYTRTGDDIGAAFPDIIEAVDFDGVLDGELLIRDEDGEPAPFNELQQRLNRKKPPRKLIAESPAFIRVYDLLFDGGEDLRTLPLDERRRRLAGWVGGRGDRFDHSADIAFDSWDELAAIREGARDAGIEGLMLKRADAPYLAGRPKGYWYKWKRDALTADLVLMYAMRGHGRRSSFYSDFTFGAWRGDGELVPVGKAYSGFTDAELVKLDKWVRAHTTNRFGPVREVEQGLVLEIAFDSLHLSKRHKSGIAMRFPRIHRIRWDKPPAEAEALDNLRKLIT